MQRNWLVKAGRVDYSSRCRMTNPSSTVTGYVCTRSHGAYSEQPVRRSNSQRCDVSHRDLGSGYVHLEGIRGKACRGRRRCETRPLTAEMNANRYASAFGRFVDGMVQSIRVKPALASPGARSLETVATIALSPRSRSNHFEDRHRPGQAGASGAYVRLGDWMCQAGS